MRPILRCRPNSLGVLNIVQTTSGVRSPATMRDSKSSGPYCSARLTNGRQTEIVSGGPGCSRVVRWFRKTWEQLFPAAPSCLVSPGYEPGGRTFESCRAHHPNEVGVDTPCHSSSCRPSASPRCEHASRAGRTTPTSDNALHTLVHAAPRLRLGASMCESCRAHHNPSVDGSKPAICRQFKTGHFGLAAETGEFYFVASSGASRCGPWCASSAGRT